MKNIKKETNVLLILLFVLLLPFSVFGQERIKIAEYQPNTSKVITSGEHEGLTQFTFRSGVPTIIEKKDSTLYFITTDDTVLVEFELDMINNIEVNSLGRAFVFRYSNYNKKNLNYKFPKNKLDKKLEGEKIIFLKDGKKIATYSIGNIFYNKNNEKISPLSVIKDKDKYNMSFGEEILYTQTDTFIFTNPDSLEDITLYEGQPNQNASNDLWVGRISGVNQLSILRFTAIKDSNIAVVESAGVFLKIKDANYNNDPAIIKINAHKRAWVVGEATYEIYSTGNAWADSGARGEADIYKAPSQSDSVDWGTVNWAQNSWQQYRATNSIQTIIDNVGADESIRLSSTLTPSAGTNRVRWFSDTTAGSEAYLVIIGTIGGNDIFNTGITKAVRKGTIIGETLQNGEITKEVYP